MFRRNLTIMCALAALTTGSATVVSAQGLDLNLPVYFTFSQPVALPRVTLPAGKYLFQLVNSGSSRSVVQISSPDRKQQYGIFITMPAERNQAPNNAEVRFLEAPANSPAAVATYWYPGRKTGWEFVYPRAQALQLAKSSGQSVLTTKTDVSADDMRNASLGRVGPTGGDVIVVDQPVAITGNAVDGQIATDITPEPTLMASAAPARSARTRLPKTASVMPLVTMAGVALFAMGGLLGYRRRQDA